MTSRQPGVTTGPDRDIMGQPLDGRSNYNAWNQFSGILSDAGNVSWGTTFGRIADWANYTVPDAQQRNAEIFAPHRGMTSQGREFAMHLDRVRGGTVSGIAYGTAVELGASTATQDLVYGLGSAGDGFLIAGGTIAGARVPFIGNQRGLSIVNGENGVHANSRHSARTTWLYELRTSDGQLLKYGISVNPATRYPRSFMKDKMIDRIASGTRADMLALERQMVTANPGPLNNEPWAVKARGGN